ncbi:hypothetical protein GAGA_1074 [Paraglaciecola agarilytica NO2]|uniref:Transposase n=1 Tax=Paraglaciecola agarilytica NO2 TaxID=1125747 RepID=A0ABQ0I3N6_9ALTE|nr:hypothetical protein GAGA_1074 [Paraglaciecola agarilytica NO2]
MGAPCVKRKKSAKTRFLAGVHFLTILIVTVDDLFKQVICRFEERSCAVRIH